jgi:hypothetical protein
MAVFRIEPLDFAFQEVHSLTNVEAHRFFAVVLSGECAEHRRGGVGSECPLDELWETLTAIG